MSIIRDREVVKAEHINGGNGYILRDMLLSEKQLNGICTYVSCITLDPGCEIGNHTHSEDSEMYFLIEGSAMYTDNGEDCEVHAGDVMFCEKGDSHAIKNASDAPVRFVAVIQK